MNKLNLFIPITKVDAAKRLVYGVATAELEDRSGEICDYASTKPFYEKWSGDIAKTTGGKSLGNLRAMHGKVAAGKVTDIAFDDDAKKIEICAKVVDDQEWRKVEEGVYTGFSQGGQYVKQWTGEDGKKRYTADPTEVSLVDLPCLKEATFQVIKADGEVELRKFKTEEPPTAEPEPQPNAEDLGVVQKWTTPDGKAFDKKADALAHVAALNKTADPVNPLLDAIEKARGAPAPVVEDPLKKAFTSQALKELVKAFETAREAKPDPLAKGLYTLGWVARLMEELENLHSSVGTEAAMEQDGSGLPAQIKDILTAFGDMVLAMAQEEVAELLNGTDVNVTVVDGFYYAAAVTDLVKADTALMEKVGARHSKQDMASLQLIHDNVAKMGAMCSPDNCPANEDDDADADKAAASGDLAKVAAERDRLAKQIEEAFPAIAALGEELKALKAARAEDQARIKQLEDQPMPSAHSGVTVEKGGPAADPTRDEALLLLKEMPPEAIATAMFKLAHKNPLPVFKKGQVQG